jgi:HAMP domain-containing protein
MNKTLVTFLTVFLIALAGLALVAWDRVLRPSSHFHFTDLAESFLAGRLDTDTPMRRKGVGPIPGDPEGLARAVDRHLGENGGWNDWASYFEITLPGGERYTGVWPWKYRGKGAAGADRREEFVTTDGRRLKLSPSEAVRLCEELPKGMDADQALAWAERDRYPQRRQACAEYDGPGMERCPAGSRPFTCLQRHHFVSFPPGPALLALPAVGLVHYNFNDVLFTLLLAGLCAVLLLGLLRQLRGLNYSGQDQRTDLWMVFAFVFGSVFFFSAVRGEVWFTALVCGVLFNLIYVWAATDLRHPLVAGLALAAAFTCRTSALFGAVYFGLMLVLLRAPWDRAGMLLRFKKALAFGLPCLVVGVALMFYNKARYHSFGEFGHTYLMDGTRDSIVDHGMFSFWFLSRNLAAAFTNVPLPLDHWPWLRVSGNGLSLLLTTPIFLYLLWPRRGDQVQEGLDRFRWPLRRILWVSVAAVGVPLLLYQNTGWLQFGYRFSLDVMPFLWVLFALDRRPRGPLFKGLIVLGFLVNLFGAITFGRFGAFYG